jgi:uncharacterized protein with GYD domain
MGPPTLATAYSPTKGCGMPTYLILGKYTAQGLQHIKDAPKRAQAFKDAAEKAGVKVKELAWLAGEYDIMTIVDAPDEETVVALNLNVSKQGNLNGTRMRLITSADLDKILDKVS